MISIIYIYLRRNLSLPSSLGRMLRLKVLYCDGLCNIGKCDNVFIIGNVL